MGARKGFNLFILNKDVNSVIGNKKSLEDLGVLIDKITEAVKHEIKKQEGRFLGDFFSPLAASIAQPVISSVVQYTSGRGFRRAERKYMNKTF